MPSLPTSRPPKSDPQTDQPQALHLPAAIIAVLSPKPYLLAHLQSDPPTRPSNRSPTTFRELAVTTSSLTNCLGSSVVRNGETAVACGIQPEILLASAIADPPRRKPRQRSNNPPSNSADAKQRRREDAEDLAHLQLLVPNIDLSTGCSPSHLPGQAPNTSAQSLSQRLYRQLLACGLVDLQDLQIWRRKADVELEETSSEEMGDVTEDEDEEEVVAYFTLHIHMTVLSLSGQNSLFAVAWTAMLAALRDLRLPKAAWDPDREIVLCEDDVTLATGLHLRGCPIASCWAVFGGVNGVAAAAEGDETAGKRWVLADPDAFEDGVCDEVVTIVVDCSSGKGKTRILRVEKSGGDGFIGREHMRELVTMAETRWKDVVAALPPPRNQSGEAAT